MLALLLQVWYFLAVVKDTHRHQYHFPLYVFKDFTLVLLFKIWNHTHLYKKENMDESGNNR